jgi:phage terminase large subunit-like protein
MTPEAIAPVLALPPDFWETLSLEERLIAPYAFELWLRPEQRIPRYDWSYHGHICGRGFGKSFAIAVEQNRRVQCGETRALALMAPTEPRAKEVQIDFLIATSPPWFKAEEYDGGVIWPNGVQGLVFTPEAPGRSRSGNFDTSWLCEIVDWQPTTRLEAFNNITTATRIGRAQVFWDTTSKGKNEVIQVLMALNASDPRQYPIQRGAMLDNPLLSAKYLRNEARKYTGRSLLEEVYGYVFGESAGALWKQAWLDEHRRAAPPTNPELRLVSIDPALSNRSDADETGLVVGSRDRAGEVYAEADRSRRMAPEEWGDIAIRECAEGGAAGCVIERNHLGDNATYVLKSRAENRGFRVELLKRWTEDKCESFPARKPGVIYVRECVSADGKGARAQGPAVETEAGRVHIVGRLAELELELTTYEPGTSRSPNRFDAFSQLVTELRELWREAPKRNAKQDVKAAKEANAALLAKLTAAGRRRGVGL